MKELWEEQIKCNERTIANMQSLKVLIELLTERVRVLEEQNGSAHAGHTLLQGVTGNQE